MKKGAREGDYNRTELKGVSTPWQHLCGCYLAKEMRPQTQTPFRVIRLYNYSVYRVSLNIGRLLLAIHLFAPFFVMNAGSMDQSRRPRGRYTWHTWQVIEYIYCWQLQKQKEEIYANRISSLSLHHDPKRNVQFTLRLEERRLGLEKSPRVHPTTMELCVNLLSG